MGNGPIDRIDACLHLYPSCRNFAMWVPAIPLTWRDRHLHWEITHAAHLSGQYRSHRPHGHAPAHHGETWSSHWRRTMGHGSSPTHRHRARQQHHGRGVCVCYDIWQGLVVVCHEHLAHEGVRDLGRGDGKNHGSREICSTYHTNSCHRRHITRID